MYTCERLVGCQAAIAGKPGSHNGLVYTCERLVGCQAAIAGKPGSHSWTVYICGRWVGCQAAIAGKPGSHSWTVYICGRLVGCQAAIAGKPGSHSWTVYICGRLAGCQAAKVKRSQPSAAPKAGRISRPTSHFPSTARYPRAACSRAAPLRAAHRPCGSWHPGPPGACEWPATIPRYCC